MPLVPGTKLGPYEVVAHIGTGGMGEVYRARDTRLDREVAIKVLAERFAGDPDRLRRFEQEARAVAALNHPHICQLHDIGPGYLVLEYVEGKPIEGPLSPRDAVHFALQIAGALEAAHRRGILHRDLKPANILVTRDRVAKLLDFGLAKLMEAGNQAEDLTQTQDGFVVGTVPYMSPEQVRGERLDVRSDVFSFGAVLYEVVSGQRAFDGASSADVILSILRDEPAPLEVPRALAQVLTRCLAKQRDERYATIADVRSALEHVNASNSAPSAPSVVVLPFANVSADPENEYFSDGLAEEIINTLAQVPGLKVIARTSAFTFKGKFTDVRRIAEALGVAHVLEGSVRRAGSRVRITAQLIAAADGMHLWSNRYDRELQDTFAIQDEIASAITEALCTTLNVSDTADPRRAPSIAAHEALLKGRHLLARHLDSTFARARDHFAEAIGLDSKYAEPHAQLGLLELQQVMQGTQSLRDAAPSIRTHATRALSLAPDDPGPCFLLGAVAAAHDFAWEQAADFFTRALAGHSVVSEASYTYASFYLQPLGRFAAAVDHMERAVERDPLNVFFRGVLASHLTHAGLHDRAVREAEAAIEIDPSNWVPHFTLGQTHLHCGRWREAALALQHARRLAPEHRLTTGLLAGTLRQLGRSTEADELLVALDATSTSVFGRALCHLVSGELAEGAAAYERAIEQRDPFTIVFCSGPLTGELRRSAHWSRLGRLMNMPAVSNG